MPTETIRPDGTVSGFFYGYTGAASAHAALNDNSDSSYVSNSVGPWNPGLTVSLGSPTIPAGAAIISVTPRIRVRGEQLIADTP